MGIAERKAREKDELRRKILEAAMQLFVEKGFEATTIRQIAKKIEYSPGTIYLHFKSKDEIFFAIHEEAFDLLAERLTPQMEIKHPIERLQALGREYLNFAFEYPDYYDLMFIQQGPMKVIDEMHGFDEEDFSTQEWAAVMKSFGCLYQTVSEAIEQAYFKNKNVDLTTFSIWSSMHGMTSLCICQRMKMFPAWKPEEMITDAMNQMLEMFQK